jgi:hypothetical protein
LLGQQGADPGRAFDRPDAGLEPLGPSQEPLPLMAVSPNSDLVDNPLAAVDHWSLVSGAREVEFCCMDD